MDQLDRAYTKKLVNGLQSGLDHADVDNSTCTITFYWLNGTSSSMTFPRPADGEKGDTGLGIKKVEINASNHLICTLDDDTTIDAGVLPSGGGGSGTTDYTDLTNKPSINGIELSGDKSLYDLGITNYDDTQVNQYIKDLQDNKVDKVTGKSLLDDTEISRLANVDNYDDTAIKQDIDDIDGRLLDNVSFSSDYKNIVLNRKNGLDPYTIPIASIIHNAKITELNDVDSTDIGNGKTLIYDALSQKHKYVDSTGTDELVKMDSTTEAKYLSDLIDNNTVINDNGTLKVNKLDGQEVTIAEINYLKGLTMNVMDLVNLFSNGGVKILNTPVNTYSDLLTIDKTDFIDGISYLVYVLTDETHDNAKTTYLVDKVSDTPTYFGFAGEHRDFTTNPIDLANEVTGKLGTNNIDVDALWNLLTIDNTYKTLTSTNSVFGTHGAKAMYDELSTAIGDKANSSDLTTHTNDTDIHVTSSKRTEWNKKVKIKNLSYSYTGNLTILDEVILSILNATNPQTFDVGVYSGTIASTHSGGGDLGMWSGNYLLTVSNNSNYGTSGIVSTQGKSYSIHYSNGSWVIKRLCSTSVTDVPVTQLTPETNGLTFDNSDSTFAYIVKNGICYVNVWSIKSTIAGSEIVLSTKIPTPAIPSVHPIHTNQINNNSYSIVGQLYTRGNAIILNIPAAFERGYCSFSYLVAES